MLSEGSRRRDKLLRQFLHHKVRIVDQVPQQVDPFPAQPFLRLHFLQGRLQLFAEQRQVFRTDVLRHFKAVDLIRGEHFGAILPCAAKENNVKKCGQSETQT